jgi:hypothetical protein
MSSNDSSMMELSQSVGKAIGLLEGMAHSMAEIKQEQLYLRENMSSASTVKELDEKIKQAQKDISALKQEMFHSKSLRAFWSKNWYRLLSMSALGLGLLWGAFEWNKSVQELSAKMDAPYHHEERKSRVTD